MNTQKLLESLVGDPEEIRGKIESGWMLQKNIDFGLQINTEGRNWFYQEILYDSLLLFLTNIPYNYFGVKQKPKKYKNKISFFLPKKAFKQYVNETLKSYNYEQIEEQLSMLGKNKVVTRRGVVVELFTMFQIEGIDEYWGLLIDITTLPYVCTADIILTLAAIKVIPAFDCSPTLELADMIEEREKAGLKIPVMMDVVNKEKQKFTCF